MPALSVRVVLVRPHYPGNIGAVARVMGNMGLDDLVLVAPACDPLENNARQMATHGEAILERARVVSDFESALADVHSVAATSAHVGGLFRKQSAGPLERMVPHLTERLHAGQTIALVFGPEPTGLTNAEVARCQYLLQIPTSDSHPSLNLAQAVAICLYELNKQVRELPARSKGGSELPLTLPVTRDEQDRLFAHLQLALEKIHFLYGEKAEPLMHALRHLLAKAQLDAMEIKLLHGLARQICWYVDHHSGKIDS